MLIRDGTDPERRHAVADLGVRVIETPGAMAGVDLAKGLAALAEAGLTRVLVEGGAKIAAALLRADLVDRIAWFHAPSVMGGDGWPAVQAFGMFIVFEIEPERKGCAAAIMRMCAMYGMKRLPFLPALVRAVEHRVVLRP